MKACLVILTLMAMAPGTQSLGEDLREADVKALESQCEAARETQLKPLRDAEIARCKAEKRSDDPGYCERYYSDLGNAVRLPNGTFKPRMFDDLPECVAAFKARKTLVR